MGGATNARAWSSYLDFLLQGTIRNFTESHVAHWYVGAPVAEYPDFVALAVVMLLTTVVALGAKCSSWFNSLFAFVNISVLVFVIVVGFIYADLDNWKLEDHGGFMPYGFSGVLAGSGACFWAYSGFEIITCAVEEARNPRRDIPISMLSCLSLVAALYMLTSAAVTMVTPYYTIDATAPLPSAFAAKGIIWAKYVVAIGPLCGLTTTLLGSVYSFVRVSYAIADDGLLFPVFCRVMPCSKVPVWSVLIAGSLMGLLALAFDLAELIGFSVVMTLLGYVLICAAVIILRYRPDDSGQHEAREGSARQLESVRFQEEAVFIGGDNNPVVASGTDPVENGTGGDLDQAGSHRRHASQSSTSSREDSLAPVPPPQLEFVNAGGVKPHYPQLARWLHFPPGQWPCIAIFLIIFSMTSVVIIGVHARHLLLSGSWWLVLVVCLLLVFTIALIISLYAHHQNLRDLTVKVCLLLSDGLLTSDQSLEAVCWYVYTCASSAR